MNKSLNMEDIRKEEEYLFLEKVDANINASCDLTSQCENQQLSFWDGSVR